MSDIATLLPRVLAGSERAWQQLFLAYGPRVELIVRKSRAMGSLRNNPDDYRNVMTRVFERLRRDDFRALRLYGEWQNRNDVRGFDDWLAVVTTNVARAYVEERLGAREQPIRRLINTLAGALEDDDEALAVGAHITPRLAARQVMDAARAELEPAQLAVLEGWLQGRDLDPDERKVLRAALARLRRRFA